MSVTEQGVQSALAAVYEIISTDPGPWMYKDPAYWWAFVEKLLEAGASAENEVKGRRGELRGTTDGGRHRMGRGAMCLCGVLW